jgi:cation:H+ antiporter
VIAAAIFLVLGLALLMYAGDHFVTGASRMAAALQISPVIVGALVLGFGTSAPEMVVSGLAAWRGNLDLGLGNIVGSNVANLSLGLGVAGLISSVAISKSAIRREGPISLGAALLFSLVVVDGTLSRIDGIILLVTLFAVILYLIKSPSTAAEVFAKDSTNMFTPNLVLALVGLTGVLIGAQLAVTGATRLATGWGLSGGFIGFSIVALGTSLPELVTTIAAARQKETGLIIGNLFGSNLFNSLAVGGSMGLVGGGVLEDATMRGRGIYLMLAVIFFAYLLCVWGRKISRSKGALLLALYAGTMLLVGLA